MGVTCDANSDKIITLPSQGIRAMTIESVSFALHLPNTVSEGAKSNNR